MKSRDDTVSASGKGIWNNSVSRCMYLYISPGNLEEISLTCLPKKKSQMVSLHQEACSNKLCHSMG